MQDLNDKINNGGATADGQLSADEWNQLPSEIQNIIEALGITLSGADLNQLGKGIAGYVANGAFYTDGGAANAYVLAAVGGKQLPPAYADGMLASFFPDNSNTGASTVNIGALGVKNIVNTSGGGKIASGIRVDLRYRLGTDDFEILNSPVASRENLLIGNFSINQRGVSGTVILGAGVYGHDRFKAGSGGCTYTFATSNNVTTITISAGTLIQEVEGLNIESADYVLSWQGTAQAQIDSGGFGDSGLVADTLVGGTSAIIEWGTGTISLPQLEKGVIPTDFVPRLIGDELALCERYFQALTTRVESATQQGTIIIFHTEMRATPTVSGGGAGFTSTGINADGWTGHQTTAASVALSFAAEL
ncbi:MAG: hypothetical protein KAR42_15455 [candidate division Zixibacteria bacterium]|nr:hypothetical protein [candidate division Zixibacteria bacterium]